MSIQNILRERHIQEILHFTTNKGITGILSSGYLKSRNLLSKDKYLEYIYKFNCLDRSKDKDWWGYVNLSITKVNRKLFGISSGKWHAKEDGWWCIVSLDPEICTHNDVHFTTTNNMYSGVLRNTGKSGLIKMFQDKTIQWPSSIVTRSVDHPDNLPTCEQAEILYPNQISIKFIKKIYVQDDETAAKFESIQFLYPETKHIECKVRKDLF